jgi:hypothetical protein
VLLAEAGSLPPDFAANEATAAPVDEGPGADAVVLSPAGVPVGLELPRLGVDAPVDPVGLIGRELQVPDDGNRVGWWTGSVVAGSPSGSTVLDGHIDTPQGPGALSAMTDIEPQDLVVVTVAGGASVSYRVTVRRSYPKADGLPPEVFGDADGPPRLVLITCGGRYDFGRAEYDDNVVVTAVPA